VMPCDTKKDGAKGPAQNPLGLGTQNYADLFRSIEEQYGLHIWVRRGDPRSGRARAVTEDEGGTDLITMMGDVGMDIEPAKGVAIQEGVGMISEWLDYNDEKPIDALNQPSLYVSEECEQVIDCLRMWTGGDGEKGASKDFIDLLRYAAVDDIDEVTDDMMTVKGGFGY
jgi:hypothetical protein